MSVHTTVVYCPAYCLKADGSRLTMMNRQCTEQAIKEVVEKRASYIIFSTAYDGLWEREADYKAAMAATYNVSSFIVIPAINDTYGETKRVKTVLEDCKATTLIIVAEKHHMKRALYAFRRAMPGLKLVPVPIICERFEMTLEPSIIKSIRAGYKSLWILWNWLFYLLTPLLMKNQLDRCSTETIPLTSKTSMVF